MNSFCGDSLIVAIHVREGDFAPPDQVDYSVPSPVRIPLSWYMDWLTAFHANTTVVQLAKSWQDRHCPLPIHTPFLNRIAVFLASENASVADAMRRAGYQVTTLTDVVRDTFDQYTTLNDHVKGFFGDWWLLSQFHVLVAGHSTFSLTTSMHSPYSDANEALFFSPDPTALAIAPFDPWNFTYDFAAFSRGGKQIVH